MKAKPDDNIDVKFVIQFVDVKVEKNITVPKAALPRIFDIIMRTRKYSAWLSYHSTSYSCDDGFEFTYHAPSCAVFNTMEGTIERLEDMADFINKIGAIIGDVLKQAEA